MQWSFDEYAEKLRIGGGKERIASLLTPRFIRDASLPTEPALLRDLIERLHRRKTEIYISLVQGGLLPGRPGVARLTKEVADAGWRLAVASTSAPASVQAVLEHVVGVGLARRFDVVLAGDVVARKKPAADIYRLVSERLRVPPSETLVIEDSRNGLVAANAADLCTLVTMSTFTAAEDFSEAALVVTSLGDPDGEAMEVVANRTTARPQDWVVLDDLVACLRAGPSRSKRTRCEVDLSLEPAGVGSHCLRSLRLISTSQISGTCWPWEGTPYLWWTVAPRDRQRRLRITWGKDQEVFVGRRQEGCFRPRITLSGNSTNQLRAEACRVANEE